jgi:hypothetical protein
MLSQLWSRKGAAHSAQGAQTARRQRLARDRKGNRALHASGYDRTVKLLSNLQALAVEDGSQADFSRRLASIRERHEKKGKFIERLTDSDATAAITELSE